MDYRLGLLLTVACVLGVCAAKKHSDKAICIVDKTTGMATAGIEGHIIFEQKKDEMEIKVNLTGFTGSVGDKHGFHVHTTGNMSSACMATDGHYNPEGKNHSAPTDANRHVGDLGNIVEQANGVILTEFEDKVVKLDGDHSIVGRAMVIHAGEDDLGKGGDAGSITTGNAGGRMGCCIITKDIPEGYIVGAASDITRSVVLIMTSALFVFLVRL